MCLITEQKRPFTATEDMAIYKLFENKMYSPLMGFKYEEGKVYKTALRRGDKTCFDNIDQNYLENEYGRYWQNFVGGKIKSIGRGYHGALKRKRLYSGEKYLNYGRIIRKVIIPKGSKYYLDATGLIVSNQIILPLNKKS